MFGIQADGIEEIAPKAISENGMALIKFFMQDDNKKIVDDSYTLVNKGENNYISQYPLLEEQNIYILNSEVEKQKLDEIFTIATSAFILTMQSFGDENNMNTEDNSTNIDINELYSILPMLNNLPEEKIAQNILNAKKQNAETASQVAKVFTKAFYNELGVNMQNIREFTRLFFITRS